MVFTKLSAQEKDAFFGLLDEYFQSRPELFGQNDGLAGTTTGVPGRSNNPYAASMPNSADAAQAAAMAGRVAAATLAFSGGGAPSPSPSQSQSQPPSLSRRIGGGFPDVSGGATRTSLERVVSPGSEVDKLTTKKVSAFSAFRKPEKVGTPGVTIPSAFVAPKSTFGPPPIRRPASEASTGGSGDTIGAHAQRLAAPAPEVPQGDWAEALYDYQSEDPGDLAIEAGTRVLVTDKSSDDWWTGRVDGQGREGLFPASYVKLL